MFKNKVNFIAALMLLLPVLVMQAEKAVNSDDKIRKHEEFLESIGVYKCGEIPAREGYSGYPFSCELIKSTFTQQLIKEYLALNGDALQSEQRYKVQQLYTSWASSGYEEHQKNLEQTNCVVTKILDGKPELIGFMNPEQQAAWQKYCDKKSTRAKVRAEKLAKQEETLKLAKQEETLNMINNFFLAR